MALAPSEGGPNGRIGPSDYEGCHTNMLGLVEQGAALVVSWDDAYVSAFALQFTKRCGSLILKWQLRRAGTGPVLCAERAARRRIS